MSTVKRLNIGYDSAVEDRGARFYIDGVQFNENKLTYIRKEEHAKLIIFYFTKYLQVEEQQTRNLLKFNIKTNEIIFPPENSLGTNKGRGRKDIFTIRGSGKWTKKQYTIQ